MLQTVDDGETIRFEFERTPDGDRTSSRLSERQIVDSSDPEEGHLFADMRLDPDAAPWDLISDELAARRRRDSAAKAAPATWGPESALGSVELQVGRPVSKRT